MLTKIVKILKRSPEAIPLLGAVTGGLVFATYMSYRAIFIYPDVVWDHKKNPYPWLNVKPTEDVKMLSTGYDFSKLTHERPDISGEN